MDAIDLHVHSTFSDGTLTPSELISRAKQFHLAAMALTDHDTIEGIPEAVQAASEQNLELVPGVELSTFWDEKEIHIVGLFIDYTDKTFQKELESLRDVRRNRNIAMCEKFTQLEASILQYAIQGKLVEQRVEEGTAEALYQQIQAEKQKLIKDGKIKKGKPLTDIADDEIPFDIPDSWKWVRLDDVVIKTIKRGKSPKYTEKSNVLVFAQKCIRRQDTLIYHCLCVWMKPY